MFREWGFLITEMVVLILLAALLGVLVGWLIWGRRSQVTAESSSLMSADIESCHDRLQACEEAGAYREAMIAQLQGELSEAREALSDAQKALGEARTALDNATDDTPIRLTAPRDGKPDDLKKIKGVGPKLEKLCNELGFFHFDQIAAWSGREVAWVDANLGTFKGRVSRDNWVEQAKLLASGGETEFSKRVDDGEVY